MKYSQILNFSKSYLNKKGIESYVLDSYLLLSKVINKDRIFIEINKDRYLNIIQIIYFFYLMYKRGKNYPIAYIIGEKEFFGRLFSINPNVLIPRPETEILIETVLQNIENEKYLNIIDLGTGSGIIGITLYLELKNKINKLYFVDISKKALDIAKKNIKKFDIQNYEIYNLDLLNNFQFIYDRYIIVANLPYINIKEKTKLKTIKYEPHIALFTDNKGLWYYKKLILDIKKLKNKEVDLFFEFSPEQKKYLEKFFVQNNIKNFVFYKDLSNLYRICYVKFY